MLEKWTSVAGASDGSPHEPVVFERLVGRERMTRLVIRAAGMPGEISEPKEIILCHWPNSIQHWAVWTRTLSTGGLHYGRYFDHQRDASFHFESVIRAVGAIERTIVTRETV